MTKLIIKISKEDSNPRPRQNNSMEFDSTTIPSIMQSNECSSSSSKGPSPSRDKQSKNWSGMKENAGAQTDEQEIFDAV